MQTKCQTGEKNMMKRVRAHFPAILLICCVLLALLTAEAFAADVVSSGSCGDDLTWMLDSDGLLTISGSGAMKNNAQTWPYESIKTVEINPGVTSVGNGAFSNCSNLTSVTIPDGVTSIGEFAFYQCGKLTDIIIPHDLVFISASAFEKCTSLENITIPDSVTSIGSYAFSGCSALANVYLSSMDAWTRIHFGNYAATPMPLAKNIYLNGEKIVSVTVPRGVTRLEYTFAGFKDLSSVILPDSLMVIGSNAFSDCTSLTNISLPDTITEIGSNAFNDCSSLTSITIPDSVTTIGGGAFGYCASLESIEMPRSLTIIDKNLFWGCSSLTSITIPNGVTRIGDYAFKGCSSLTDITLPNSVTSIGKYTFQYCKALQSIIIPNSVTKIGSAAFNRCYALKDIMIPNGVTAIYDYTFQHCSALSRIVIPDGATYLGRGAFQDCSTLSSIVIPNSVTEIESYAFHDCSGLTDVYYCGTKSEWGKINIYSNNESLLNATIHYNYDRSDPSSVTGHNKRWGNVSLDYLSTVNGEKSLSGLTYDDDWFLLDSYTYNHELATMSLGLAMAGFESAPYAENGDKRIRALYQSLGFNDETYHCENYGVSDDGDVGIAISSKTILDGNSAPVTLMAVTLRGGGYGDGGWAGNFAVGASGVYHDGFHTAAVYARNAVSSYIADNKIDRKTVRLWLTGYSRSAAVANLLSASLSVNGVCKRANIYTYTFATPSNQQMQYFSSSYDNIFNIVNPIDIVPMVPPTQWNFGKQGTTYQLNFFGTETPEYSTFLAYFKSLSGEAYSADSQQRVMNTYLMETLCASFTDRETYRAYLQDVLVGLKTGDPTAADGIFCGKTSLEELKKCLSDKKYASLAAKILSAYHARKESYGSDDPYISFLNRLYEIAKSVAWDHAAGVEGSNTLLLSSILNIAEEGFSSDLLKQHWPEVYMAWMLTADKDWNFPALKTATYRTATVACPVDVEVYDEKDRLVARMTTQTAHITEDGTAYSFVVSNVDESVTTLEAATYGEIKMFVLPNDQEYRVVISTNDTFASGDTMTYSVSEYDGAKQNASVVYEAVELAQSSVFSAAVTTSENAIETCTISNGEQVLQPTRVENMKGPAHIVSDLNVERYGAQYTVSGSVAADVPVTLLCAVYDAEGRMTAVFSRVFDAGETKAAFSESISAENSDGLIKIFTLDAGHIPLDEPLIMYL